MDDSRNREYRGHERSAAVRMCLERRDCHPGLMVPFEQDVRACFTLGSRGSDLVVVAIWRPESDLNVVRYGGAQRLLEAFLSTMNVWPALASAQLNEMVASPSP